jgi:NAD(P)-dependent dehydrogenase (short-subunit alcohol dehydrogenase family)
MAKLLQFTERWTSDRNMPDQFGKVAIVTGGTSGLGYEIAKQLARHHAHVIIAARNEAKGFRCAAVHCCLSTVPGCVDGCVGRSVGCCCCLAAASLCCCSAARRRRALL